MSKGLWIILPEHSEGQILGVWGDPGRGGGTRARKTPAGISGRGWWGGLRDYGTAEWPRGQLIGIQPMGEVVIFKPVAAVLDEPLPCEVLHFDGEFKERGVGPCRWLLEPSNGLVQPRGGGEDVLWLPVARGGHLLIRAGWRIKRA